MLYFGEDNEFIKAECETCGRVLKVHKAFADVAPVGYSLNTPVKCKCGSISRIIKGNAESTRAKRKIYAGAVPAYKNTFGIRRAVSESTIPDIPSNQFDDTVKCHNCGSTQLTACKKGFGLVNAGAGAILFGPVGLLAGFVGSGQIIITCLKCGNSWEAG